MKSTQTIGKDLQNLIAMYIAGVFVAALALYLLVVSPAFAKAKQNTLQRKIVEAEIVQLEQLREDTVTLAQNYDAIKARRDAILGLLPGQDEVENLLLLLNKYASDSGIVFTSMTPDNVSFGTEGLGYNLYPFNMIVSGPYGSIQGENREAMIGFLKLLEEGARFVDVTGLILETGESKGSTISGTIAINAYYKTIQDDTAEGADIIQGIEGVEG